MQWLIDGHPVELDIIGEGLPVLMLHGFPLDRRALRRSVDPVFEGRTGYRRIHVDLPGFGASPRVPGIDGSAAMVDFVLRLIDEVAGDGPLLLVGESWGAYLARAVIARRPLQVAGAALLVPMTSPRSPIGTSRRIACCTRSPASSPVPPMPTPPRSAGSGRSSTARRGRTSVR